MEVMPHRIRPSQRAGADEVFNPRETDAPAAISEATGGAGADVVLEMCGNPDAIQLAFQVLRGGGRISLLGLPSEPIRQ